MIGLIIIFITLIILYLGVILFAGATLVKISLFALDKLVVFIASWYYTHHYFSVKFSSGYAIYFWDVLAAILAVVIYSVLFQFIHKRFNLLGKLLNLAISFFSSMTVYCILVNGFITNEKSYFLPTSGKCKQNKGKGILVEKTEKLYFYEVEEGDRSYLKYG